MDHVLNKPKDAGPAITHKRWSNAQVKIPKNVPASSVTGWGKCLSNRISKRAGRRVLNFVPTLKTRQEAAKFYGGEMEPSRVLEVTLPGFKLPEIESPAFTATKVNRREFFKILQSLFDRFQVMRADPRGHDSL